MTTLVALLSALAVVAAAVRQPAVTRPPMREPRVLDLAKEQLDCVWPQFSRDGSILAVHGERTAKEITTSVLSLWDGVTGTHIRTLRGKHGELGGEYDISPDGKLLAVPDWSNGCIVIYEIRTGAVVQRFQQPLVMHVWFSPDGSGLLTRSRSGWVETPDPNDVRVFDVASGKLRFAPQSAKDEMFLDPRFGPDDRVQLPTSPGGLREFDSRTGRELTVPQFRREYHGGLGYLPDQKTLVAAARGGFFLQGFHVLDERGVELRTFGRKGESYWPSGLSPGGRYVYGVPLDGPVRVWDTSTGGEVGTIPLPKGNGSLSMSVTFSPDDSHLVVVWTEPTGQGDERRRVGALFTPSGRMVSRHPRLDGVVFDRSGRSVAVLVGNPMGKGSTVTIHDAAAWLAGGAKKE